MSRAWVIEFWRGTALAVVALLGGLAFNNLGVAFLLAIAGYLAWHLHQLHRLERWLHDGKRFAPPDADGIWAEIFHHYYRLQKRNRARKQRLAALVREFRDSTAAIPDGAIVLGVRWEILWFNNAAERLLALGPQDAGQRIANLVRAPAFIEYLVRGDYRAPVVIVAPKDEALMLALQLVPYGASQHLLLVRDVTRLHRLEQMRREFVANASHELRSPLTVVSGYLDTLLDDPALLDGDLGCALAQMRAQTSRMQQIVDDLLELSRLENEGAAAPLLPIDMRALLGQVRADTMPLRKAGQTLEFAIESDATVLGAEKEIRSVVTNLVGNALAYSPEQGAVVVSYTTDTAGARIAVSDNGPGIPAEHIAHLTERFYRVDRGRARKDGGTGLGLSIVKHALQRHGGRLDIESKVGLGSTFTAVFPSERVTGRS
ncbi:MAG: phosphate regulon sensor histidine kinase PhoR [Gammaproteobacteria bacterium]